MKLNKSFCGGSRGAVFSKSALLAAGGKGVLIEVQDGQPRCFLSSFLLSVHPEYWLVDPHGGHQFFQSARAVRYQKNGQTRCTGKGNLLLISSEYNAHIICSVKLPVPMENIVITPFSSFLLCVLFLLFVTSASTVYKYFQSLRQLPFELLFHHP
jgi:hypothetical protein